MFSSISSPYNDYDAQLYGGDMLGTIRRGVNYARRAPSLRGAIGRAMEYPSLRHIGGTMDPFSDVGDVYGGRCRRRKRRVTAKQLRALAKGRAKLRAMRRLRGGAAKRRYKSSGFSLKGMSQSGVDKAVMDKARIINKLKYEYGWSDTGAGDMMPGIYPLVNKLNNIENYLNRAGKLGLTSSFPNVAIPTGWMDTLKKMQTANVSSRANSMMTTINPMNPAIRSLMKSAYPTASPGEITERIRSYKQNQYKQLVELPAYNPNTF